MGNGAGSKRTQPVIPANSTPPVPPTAGPQGVSNGPAPASQPLPPQPANTSPTNKPPQELLPSGGSAATQDATGVKPVPAAPVKPNDKSDPVPGCLKFLINSSSTGGKAVRCSPGDVAAFGRNADKRQKLCPAFLKSLENLRAGDGNYTEDAAMEDLLTVCKMSDLTDTAVADELVGKRYPEIFVKIWKAVYHEDMYTSEELRRQYIVYNLLKQATINFTHVSWKLCAEMGSTKYGIVPLMAREFEHPLMALSALKSGVKNAVWDSPRETLKKMVNILANIIRGNIDSKPVFRDANVVPHLEELLSCRFLIMRAKALFCLVYLINEDENEALNTTDDNITFVIKVLGKCLDGQGHYSEHYTFLAEVVVDGIVSLAHNDSNKVNLVKKGVLPNLISMLKTDRLAEKRSAARAVWKLAFHEENKALFKTNETLITALKELNSKESDEQILKACKTVLWMLDVATEEGDHREGPPTSRQRPRTAKSSEKEQATAEGVGLDTNDDGEVQSLNGDDLDDEMPHLMISYQWGVQKQMIKVKELLRAAGYNVWMDVDNMGGSTLESMAAAVERSAVVLICFTEKYKRSASCRTEAEYTYKLQKSIIPLRLQEDYDPDGWLGIMIGTKLYVDLSGTDVLKEGVDKLKQQLGKRGKVLGRDTLKSTLNHPKDSPTVGSSMKAPSDSQTAAHSRRSSNPGTKDLDAKAVSAWNNDQVNAWLTKQGLGGLKNRFDGYNGQRLLGLKTIATEAPDFFFSELKKDLGFQSLLEIVTFKQALDDIL